MNRALINRIRFYTLRSTLLTCLTLLTSQALALDEGQYRIQATWGTHYLTSNEVDWAPARLASLNTVWNSQKWNFEPVEGESNEFRIRSEWPGNYLKCDGVSWSTVDVAPLRNDWWSQRWIAEPVNDNTYRLRCKWDNSGDQKYLHGSSTEWSAAQGAPLNTEWNSQIWRLHRTDETPSPPALSDDAISVGFEKHDNNMAYDRVAQDKDWDVRWTGDDMINYASISNQQASSGSKSLKVTYPDNVQINVGSQYSIPPKNEYYLSYRLKFDDNFGFNGEFVGSTGGKLPGLAANGLCSGGATCNGTNGFTSRYMWREDGRAVLYLYHMDKPGRFGEDIQLVLNGQNLYFPKGRWFTLTQRVRINDGNQSNGSIDVWFDQQKVLSRSNLRFVTNGQKVDTLYFSTFHGGSGETWWPRYTTQAYFDDFIVSPQASDVGL